MFFLGLGSNLGDRKQNIMAAIAYLRSLGGMDVKQVSSIYETEPFGLKEQPAFLNAVACIDTNLSPLELLRFCQSIELKLGRERIVHWGPRTIDIDLLVGGQKPVQTAELILPHPYLALRRFVLVPLHEIAAQFCVNGVTVEELLAHCPDKGEVLPYREI